jgi:hypothetical protein
MHPNKDISGKEIRTSLKWQANLLLGENEETKEEDLGPPVEAPTLILFCLYVSLMFEEKF